MSGDYFSGRKAVLVTKHKKEKVIKPVFENATGCEVIVDTSFDTDELGTFTREKERIGSQLEVAKKKALTGMKLNNLDLGLASEGSFGPHPAVPFLPWNREIVILIDSKNELEIYGEYSGVETNYAQSFVQNFKELKEFAQKAGFPEHFLVLRPDENSLPIIKGIDSWQELERVFHELRLKSNDGKVFVETDMRAHANPTRMANIKKATEDLIRKIKQRCPKCKTPGFDVIKRQKGLPCEWCGMPTEEIISETYGCLKCGFNMERKFPKGKEKASAESCKYCNP